MTQTFLFDKKVFTTDDFLRRKKLFAKKWKLGTKSSDEDKGKDDISVYDGLHNEG